MLNVEPVPIEVFVTQILSTKSALVIIESWPLKLEAIQIVVIKHFHDIGIYNVHPIAQNDVIHAQILSFLKNSSQILEMIDRAKKAAAIVAARGRMRDQQ